MHCGLSDRRIVPAADRPRISAREQKLPPFAPPDPGSSVPLTAAAFHPVWGDTPAAPDVVDRFDSSAPAPVRPTIAPHHILRCTQESGRLRPPRRHWLGSIDRPMPECPFDTPCHTVRGSAGQAIPSLCHVTPSATSEHSMGLVGSSPIPRSLIACCVSFQLRPLPSTGITRLHQYYGPLRHPRRPSLSLTSCRLIVFRPPLGLPVLRLVPLACMPSPLPRQDRWARSLVLSHRLRPSPDYRRVGSCISCFGACSAFSIVTACQLAKSPKATLYTGGFSSFVTSTTAPIATGWSEPVPRVGLSPTVNQRLFTAHDKVELRLWS